jgi:hypothetical protein
LRMLSDSTQSVHDEPPSPSGRGLG